MAGNKGGIELASFRDNLQHLRATRNMSQSQLAMLVGVSRQSVAKWEAETSYPEMDKLIKIVDIFDCTLDDLVRGDLTSLAHDPSRSIPEGAPPTDVCGYDEHMRKRAWRIPSGYGLIILGLGTGNLIEAFEVALGNQPVTMGFITFLVGIIAGLALLVPAHMEHKSFMKKHPYTEDFYTQSQKDIARRLEGRGIVVGVAVLISSMILPMLATYAGAGQSLASFFWWVCIALGVWILLYATLTGGRVDVDKYNTKNSGRWGIESEKNEVAVSGDEEVRND